jgi:mono/diheme cytochrome c family protein
LRSEFRPTVIARWALLLVFAASSAGCAYNMSKQPRYNPMEPSRFFPDGRSVRPVVEGTVARGAYRSGQTAFYSGTENGQVVARMPVPVTPQLLSRGRERYDIYCSPCHGRLGDGQGIVVQRGFSRPPSYHIDRLRQEPDGHYFEVITNGIGHMSSYANRVAPADRWAITAYIRALQLSQSTKISDLTPREQQALEKTR